MSVFSIVLGVVEATWEASTLFMPYVFLLLAAVVAWFHGVERSMVGAAHAVLLRYSSLLLVGLFGAGTVFILLEGLAAVLAGGMLVVIGGSVAYQRHGLPEPVAVSALTEAVWLVAVIVAVLAVLTQHVLLQSVAGLLFYGIVFWEL